MVHASELKLDGDKRQIVGEFAVVPEMIHRAQCRIDDFLGAFKSAGDRISCRITFASAATR